MTELRWSYRVFLDRVTPNGFDSWADAADLYWFEHRRDMHALVADTNKRGSLVIPVIVEDTTDGFRMIDGHRRVLTAIALLTTVPVQIIKADS